MLTFVIFPVLDFVHIVELIRPAKSHSGFGGGGSRLRSDVDLWLLKYSNFISQFFDQKFFLKMGEKGKVKVQIEFP